MVRGHVELNSVGYALRPDEDGQLVRRETLPPYVPVISQEGPPTVKDLANVDSRFWGPFTGGFGRDHTSAAKVDDPSEFRRFFDATAETRFEGGVWLPLLKNTATTPSNTEFVRASAVWKNTLYTLWERNDVQSGYGVTFATYSAGSWNGAAGNVFTDVTHEAVPMSLLAYKNMLLALFVTQDDHLCYKSTDGTTWADAATAPITTGLLADDTTQNENIKAGKLLQIGGEAVAVLWDEDSNSITFFSTTDGDTWVDKAIDIPSGKGVYGAAVYPGIDDKDKIYVLSDDGVWQVDTSAGTWVPQHIAPITIGPSAAPQGDMMVVYNGDLWFAGGSDNNRPVPVFRLTVDGGRRVIDTGLGLDRGDGMPAEALGECIHMVSTDAFLYMLVGGGVSNRNARVYAWNGEGWHTVFRNSTAAQFMAWIGVHDNTLHVGRAAPNTVFYLDEIETNPATGVSLTRETTGYVVLPYYDAGLPTTDGVWLQVRVAADDLSADTSGEHIDIDFGLEGAARTGTGLGDILSGTKTLNFASGAGVSGTDIGFDIELRRDGGGTNTDSPRFRSLELRYLKQEPNLDRFVFTVDIEATAALEESDVETVITALETARDLATLPTFTYGNITQTHVKVRPIVWKETVEGSDGIEPQTVGDAQSRRYGFAEITLDQVVV